MEFNTNKLNRQEIIDLKNLLKIPFHKKIFNIVLNIRLDSKSNMALSVETRHPNYKTINIVSVEKIKKIINYGTIAKSRGTKPFEKFNHRGR